MSYMFLLWVLQAAPFSPLPFYSSFSILNFSKPKPCLLFWLQVASFTNVFFPVVIVINLLYPKYPGPKTHDNISSVLFTLLIKKPVTVKLGHQEFCVYTVTHHIIISKIYEAYAALTGHKRNEQIAMAIWTQVLLFLCPQWAHCS